MESIKKELEYEVGLVSGTDNLYFVQLFSSSSVIFNERQTLFYIEFFCNSLENAGVIGRKFIKNYLEERLESLKQLEN